MTTPYRESLAVGGTDARNMVLDYEKWAFERRLKLEGNFPPWMQKEPSEAMQFGTWVHLALLEPRKYMDCRIVLPHGTNYATKFGKEAKAWLERKKERNPDCFLIKEEQAWAINQIMKNYLPVAEEINRVPMQVEVEIFGSYMGFQTKGMLDIRTDESIIDIKTTRNIHRCEDDLFDNAYDIQLAHYRHLAPRGRQEVIFIENVPPFRIRKIALSMTQMAQANIRWNKVMTQAIQDGLMIKASDVESSQTQNRGDDEYIPGMF